MSSKDDLRGNNFHNKCIIQNSLDHHLAPSFPITNKRSFKTFQKFTRKYARLIYDSTLRRLKVRWKRPRSQKYNQQ